MYAVQSIMEVAEGKTFAENDNVLPREGLKKRYFKTCDIRRIVGVSIFGVSIYLPRFSIDLQLIVILLIWEYNANVQILFLDSYSHVGGNSIISKHSIISFMSLICLQFF